MLFEKYYDIMENVPKPIEWDEYYNLSLKEYDMLLENNSDKEDVFQKFFEENGVG